MLSGWCLSLCRFDVNNKGCRRCGIKILVFVKPHLARTATTIKNAQIDRALCHRYRVKLNNSENALENLPTYDSVFRQARR